MADLSRHYRCGIATGRTRHRCRRDWDAELHALRSGSRWGWRQYKKSAGAGNLYDMTIHRIDFGMDLLGPLKRVCGALARFALRDRTEDGRPCAASDVDDWTAVLGEFESGAVGVWEGTTL